VQQQATTHKLPSRFSCVAYRLFVVFCLALFGGGRERNQRENILRATNKKKTVSTWETEFEMNKLLIISLPQ